MSEVKPLLIGGNERISMSVYDTWNMAKASVQDVLDLYNEMGLPKLVTDEFARLFNDNKTLIFDKITGGNISFIGANKMSIDVHPEKALDIIAKPNGYSELMQAIDNLRAKSKEGWSTSHGEDVKFDLTQVSHFFLLDGNGELQFTARVNTLIDLAGKFHLKTQRGQDLWNFVKVVVDAYYANNVHTHYSEDEAPHSIVVLIEISIQSFDFANKSFTARTEDVVKEFDHATKPWD